MPGNRPRVAQMQAVTGRVQVTSPDGATDDQRDGDHDDRNAYPTSSPGGERHGHIVSTCRRTSGTDRPVQRVLKPPCRRLEARSKPTTRLSACFDGSSSTARSRGSGPRYLDGVTEDFVCGTVRVDVGGGDPFGDLVGDDVASRQRTEHNRRNLGLRTFTTPTIQFTVLGKPVTVFVHGLDEFIDAPRHGGRRF